MSFVRWTGGAFLLFSALLGNWGCAGSTDTTTKIPPEAIKELESIFRVEPWSGERSEHWDTFNTLFKERKMAGLLKEAERLVDKFKVDGPAEEYVRAVITTINLRRMRRQQAEALTQLEQMEFPRDLLSFSILNLHRASLYSQYLGVHSWEIRNREKVITTKAPTLQQMTQDQLEQEANASYLAVWKQRKQLGDLKSESLEEYIVPSDYPRDVRSTLRDAAVYLWVEHLRSTDRWRPEHSAGIHKVPLATLLGDNVPTVNPADADINPVKRIAWLLAEHEAWHSSNGRGEAALEAFLTRVRFLHDVYKEEVDRGPIRDALRTRLATVKELPWWSVGMAALAEFVLDHETPKKFTDARDIAAACLAKPKVESTIGGGRCRTLNNYLFESKFDLKSMKLDGPNRRSIQVRYKNLKRLHFRAWKYDLPKYVLKQKNHHLLPHSSAVNVLLKGKEPSHTWTVDLPETPDLRMHTHWVTPPMEEGGAYIIMASEKPHGQYTFDEEVTKALLITISDVVLLRRPTPKGLEFYALSGDTGAPLKNTRIRLFERRYARSHSLLETQRTDASGRAFFTGRRARRIFALADHGDQIAVATERLHFGHRARKRMTERTLVYTDRSVYRPNQKIHWKILNYSGDGDKGQFKLKSGRELTVQLRDGNFEEVFKTRVKTNEFGSAAGTFEIPSGRALGDWRVQVSEGGGGSAVVKVEEYKRPTFEAKFLTSKATYRLNKPAVVRGEARYYFGLPVTDGKVTWRVVRTRVYPYWWSWYARYAPNTGEEVVGTGTSELNDDGSFAIKFTPEADERLAEGRGRAVSYRYAISADVTDAGGETRSASRTERIGFVAVDVALTTDLGFHRASKAVTLDAQRSALGGDPAPGDGQWTLFKVAQPDRVVSPADLPTVSKLGPGYLQTPADLKRPRWSSGYSGYESVISGWADGQKIKTGIATHNDQGAAKISLGRLTSGVYRLRYSTKDRFGGTFETHKDLVVIGKRTELAVPAALRLERDVLTVGDTARLLVHSGTPDQVMYLSRWRDNQLQSRTLIRGSRVVEIPITKADRGGFGFSLTYLRDHQHIELNQTIRVDWNDKKLTLNFETFRDTLRPGQREVWTVKVTSPQATHAAAEVLAYMYDRSLDMFARHGLSSPLTSYPTFGRVGGWSSLLGSHHELQLSGHQLPVVEFPERYIGPHPHRLRLGLRLRFQSAPGSPAGAGAGGMGMIGVGSGGGGMGFSHGRGRLGTMDSGRPLKAAKTKGRSGKRGLRDRFALDMVIESEEEAEEGKFGEEDRIAKSPSGAPSVTPRRNFSETAFFEPQLRTQADGTVRIEFEVPDSVTSWNVYVNAITKDLSYGMIKREVKTVKDLMVRPYLPRFLREGDSANLKVVVNNASDRTLSGTVDFDIIDPETKRSRLGDFGLTPKQAMGLAFTAQGGQSATLSVPIKAPQDLGMVAVKVIARTADFSDGELRPLPLLPGRVHLAQSRFLVLKDVTKETVEFQDLAQDDDPSRVDSSMVVTLDGQLFYGVLSALPYLVNYPYECTEQTLNRFLATGILSSLYSQYPAVARMAKTLAKRDTRLEKWDGADPNRKILLEETPWLREARGGSTKDLEKVLDPRVARAQKAAALTLLQKSQTGMGGFPWFSGGPPSPYMTLYLMNGFAKALEFGVEVPKGMSLRAWAYLKRHHVDTTIKKILAEREGGWSTVTFLNYVVSRFPDESWYGNAIGPELQKQMLDYSFAHWKEHSPYLKAYLALTLKKMGREADAQLVWESVLDAAQETKEQGTFWATSDRSWLWYNDSIESHAMALRTTLELKPKDPKLDGMALWLFVNKKLNHWKSTRATSEAIYALAHYLKKAGQLGAREETRVSVGDVEKTYIFEPDTFTGKKNQLVIRGEKIKPKTHSSVVFDKRTKGYQLASATWHFSTERMPDEARGDFLGVTRTYYRRVKSGREVTLEPLEEGAVISVGDELEVQLSLTSKHRLEYVHLRDPRGAGFEPVSTTSRYKYNLGIGWYEEIRDSATNFFFQSLPHGEYTFKYRLRATTEGSFKVGPALVQPVYASEFVAYSAGHTLEIKPQAAP